MDAEEAEVKIYNEIISKGCCKRCALRYLGQNKDLLIFEYPNTTLVNLGILPPEQEFEIMSPPNKKMKCNPCSVCLGVLENEIIDKMISEINVEEASKYFDTTFTTHITFPSCILLRDHSMKVYLRKRLPKIFNKEFVLKVNHAWRYTVERRLTQILNKEYNPKAKFTLHFHMDYDLEQQETTVIQKFASSRYRFDFRQPISRNNLQSLLNQIPDEEFTQHVEVPLRQSLYGVFLKKIDYFSESLHFIGSYCKYSRDLLQVPFYNETVTIEESVEKIIIDAVKSVNANFTNFIFKASSFDDQKVRVLGKGRTFHLQIIDPKFESLVNKECRQIEEIVTRSNSVILKNFRLEDKRDILAAMASEAVCPRTYRVLCIVYKYKNIDHCVNAVNMHTSLYVQQKTPVRLCHQRPLWSRRKKIYHIKARKLKDNLIEVELCVQVGFYVNEFINGDLRRSEPSLCDIMRAKVDVLAVDLIDLHATSQFTVDEDEVII